MAKTNFPLALAGVVNETIASTSERITRLRSVNRAVKRLPNFSLTRNTARVLIWRIWPTQVCPIASPIPNPHSSPQVRELHDVLKTTTQRVANLLNGGTPTHRLPPELLSRIVDLAVERNFYQYPRDVNSFTHVCRYWRTVVLSYPKIWSLLFLLPGNPVVVAEWLARSQKHPLTLFAQFTDMHDHPPCRYKDSAAADPDVPNEPTACSRHKAILSLDQLLPHRPRIRDISIILSSSNPNWDDDENDTLVPTLLLHQFFKDSLPNLERLDFRARHVEEEMSAIPTPTALFAMDLPRLRELKYLGASGGLMETAKDLTSCEIGYWDQWDGIVRPPIIDKKDLRALFSNNETLESLTINRCNFVYDDSQAPTVPMTDLKSLKVDRVTSEDLEMILSSIHTPQFEDLNTANVTWGPSARVFATNGSDHKLTFTLQFPGESDFQPLRYLGAEIITLRLESESLILLIQDSPALRKFLSAFNTVRVLELDKVAEGCVRDILSVPEAFPGLKTIRVAVGRMGWEGILRSLAATSESRMARGSPFETVEPYVVYRRALDQGLRTKWGKVFEEEGISKFLSKNRPDVLG